MIGTLGKRDSRFCFRRFVTEALGLKLEEGVEAGSIVGAFGELGGKGAAELDGFGDVGVGLEAAASDDLA